MVERYRPQKNIMRRFRITELSAVDNPAQEHAKATIMKRAPGEPFRKVPLTKEQFAASQIPLRHDADPAADDILKLRHVALTFEEAVHMAKLSGDDRRAFLLADHEARKAAMNGEEMPANENEDEDDEAMPNDFQAAVDKLAADGTPRHVAMQKARRAHPAAFEKYQAAPVRPDVAKAAKAEADAVTKGVAHRHAVDAAITERMMTKKVTRLDALRALRREQPALFEEA